jgi:lipoprotein signal peptidase
MVRSRILWIFVLVFVVVEIVIRSYFRSIGFGIENTGVSFGLFNGFSLWLMGILLLGVSLIVKDLENGGGFIVAGGVINFLDRVFYKNVWDYLHWPVFGLWNNGADMMIFVGVIIVIWKLFGKMKILQ